MLPGSGSGNYLRDFSYEEQLVSLGNRVEAATL